jgi:hypothetical protein
MINIENYQSLHDSNFLNIKKRITELFMGKNRGGLGYVVPLQSLEKKGLPWPKWPEFPPDQIYVEEHWEDILNYRLEEQARRLWGHDWGIPMIKPNFHCYGIESVAYGSAYTFTPCGTVPVCKVLDDLDNIAKPDLEHPAYRHALSFMKYIDENIKGKMPVEMFNTNGPTSASGLIVKLTEILIATAEQPEKLRGFFKELTELYLSFLVRQSELVRNFQYQCMHDTWLPRECGILCEDDSMMNMSPKALTEFVIPCYNRLSDAFGGIGFHCCGDYSHLFTALRDNVKNLRAVQLNAAECAFEKAAEVFRGTDTVIILRWPMNKIKMYGNRIDFITDTLRNKPDDLTVFIQAHWMPWAFHEGLIEREDNENIRAYEIMSIFERYNQYGTV